MLIHNTTFLGELLTEKNLFDLSFFEIFTSNVLFGNFLGRQQALLFLLQRKEEANAFVLKFTPEYDQRHYFQLLPPPRVKVYAEIVWLWGSVGDHILQKFYTLYVTRFRTYKIPYHPKTKI